MDFSARGLTVITIPISDNEIQYMAHELDTGRTYRISESRAQEINRNNEERENRRYTITSIQPRSGDEPIQYLVQDLTTGRSFRTYSLENIEQQLEIFSGRMTPTINPNDEGFNNPESSDNLHQKSYETLVKRLYNLSVEMPEFLIVNGLKLNFIPFSEVSSLQIERYIIEPLLQPWAGPPSSPNRIITIFGKNGMTYLLKAKYDPVSNQIFPPV